MKIPWTILLILITSSASNAQSQTVTDFDKQTKGYKIFVYQSLIRVFNKDQDAEFNMLIRDLDHLRFILSDSTGASAQSVFEKIDKGIQSEGFAGIMQVDNRDYRCHVYELAAREGKASWVATLLVNGRAGIIEMKGALDLKYMSALSSFAWEDVQGLLPDVVDGAQGEEVIFGVD